MTTNNHQLPTTNHLQYTNHMRVFNSLGSNYSLRFALQALGQFFLPDQSAPEKLKQNLESLFSGQAVLTYKGRDAIQVALTTAGIGAGDAVITQAFTCHAIESAIIKTGATPLFADIHPNTANPSLEQIKKLAARHSQVKAVIIQHTLSLPADIRPIVAWCRQHRLLLIEDLASAIGGVAPDGTPVGSHGDVVILSFGRDKIVDAVSGGAVIFRHYQQQLPSLPQTPTWLVKRDLWYPVITWKIRAFYSLGIGKIIWWLAKRVGLLTSPIAHPLDHPTALPASHAHLALIQLDQLETQLQHRRAIAQVYDQELITSIPRLGQDDQRRQAAQVRFSILIRNPNQLATWLSHRGFHLTDRWYRAAVDFGQLPYTTSYRAKSCPEAEQLASQVFNLPTHQNISLTQASKLAKLINQWQATQSETAHQKGSPHHDH